jgi:hypothetical protein
MPILLLLLLLYLASSFLRPAHPQLHLPTPQGESSDVKQKRRQDMVDAGAVPPLVRMVASSPRMPRPPAYPAPPPVAGKGKAGKGGGKAGGSSKKKKGASDPDAPQGRKDDIATSAAACLRFLATCPGFTAQLLGRSGGEIALVCPERPEP